MRPDKPVLPNPRQLLPSAEAVTVFSETCHTVDYMPSDRLPEGVDFGKVERPVHPLTRRVVNKGRLRFSNRFSNCPF